jgi:truncated hemoglobin YjbI
MVQLGADGASARFDGPKRIYRVGPRRELFTSEAAAVLFHGFLALGRADQYAYADAIQRELTARQPRDTPSRKVEEGIRVLREAATLAGGSLSIKRFEALRKQHPEWRWPPASTVRRWLGVGVWAEALRRASLPAVVPGDALESELGAAFTADEALVALRQCASDLKRVSGFNAYHAWAHHPDVRRRPGRRPLSEGAFYRLFGSFQNAIAAAGLAEDPRAAVVTANGQLRSAHYRVSDDQIAQALQEVGGRLGHPPNSSEYIHARERIYDESLALGIARALPSFSTIMRRFVRWSDALAAAGFGATHPANG